VQGGSPDLDVMVNMIDEGENAHEILGLPRNASDDEVREAYIKLAKEYHPDKHPGDLVAERRFKRISWAYNELHYFRGLQKTYQGRNLTVSYGQVLAIAIMLFVTPLAIFLLLRNVERPVPSLELRQGEGIASRGIGDAGGTAPVQETAIVGPSVPSAPRETAAVLKIDGSTRSTSMLQDNSGHAEPSSAAATPLGGVRILDLQVLSSHDAIADAAFFSPFWSIGRTKLSATATVQPDKEDARAPALELRAPPRRSKATVAKAIIPSKTVNTAAIGPNLRAQSASAALLEHTLDRIALAAAPGG
jgi:DnaJ domain